MASLLERVRAFYRDELWSREPLPAPLGWLRSVVQLGFLIGEGFVKDHLTLRAYHLTFLTMISIVPLLAIAVAMVDLIGGGPEVVETLLSKFAAVTPEAQEFLLAQVGEFNFRALGGLSGGVVLFTTILQIGGVEKGLNAIWGVHEQRPWVRRIPDYMAVIFVAPILMGIAIPLRTTIESQWLVQRMREVPWIEALLASGLEYAPFLLTLLAFGLLYWFLPNTRVRPRSALLGGAVAAVLFGLAQMAFVATVRGSSRYGAALGALAGVALFMIWVYWSWNVVLFGAEVAYAHQTLNLYRREVRGLAPGAAARETIGLAIAVQCARAFEDGNDPWTADALSDALDVPLRTVREILVELEAENILSECRDDQHGAFQLGRPAEQVRVADVLTALQGERHVELGAPEVARRVDEILSQIDRAAAPTAEGKSLRDLVFELAAPEEPTLLASE
ncbi:MAG: YihY family inner membrane protein [bacterium]|nr:YihY family inner membrane protein [bacterium]